MEVHKFKEDESLLLISYEGLVLLISSSRTGCCSDKAVFLYLESARFASEPSYRLF
jgi:hypothetical protein